MALSFLTLPKPLFFNKTTAFPSLSNQTQQGSRRNSLKVQAVSQKWEPSKVVPQADRVLVRLEQLAEKSAGGVLLPKSAVKFERYLMGEILSVGSDVGGDVQAGKKVLFSDVNAYEVDLGTEEKHCFCKQSDLLAVVE
ncbi:10 kDa chaperonin 1, chloroplastic-like [Rutidosis leptorrhynchoides]|uniref:10 kDa chaperonin 1, chloroplastic-like n=1 Tax=Rutidosis leptorrhynchoides TaxID=125765 RepID=UPI003A9A06B0